MYFRKYFITTYMFNNATYNNHNRVPWNRTL